MMNRLVWCVLALGACTSSMSSDEQTIIGGTDAPGDNATVLLVAYPTDHSTMFTCTATLVSSTALVSAAHCIDHTNYDYGVFYGADASAYPTLATLLPHLAAVSSVHIHPSYNRNAPFTADISIVNLASPATVAPMPFVRSAPTSGMVGQPARIIGYGQTVYGQYHSTREQATTLVAAIDAGDTILVGDSTYHTCVGDSGGPALIEVNGVEQIVGVDSYSDTSGCTQAAHFRRTDAYAAFIDQYAGTSPPSGGDAGMQPPSDHPDAGNGDMGDGSGCAAGGNGPGFFCLLALGLRRRRAKRS